MKISEKDVIVPLDVPKHLRQRYIKNYLEITKGSGRLMLFAGDQRLEHLNEDFYGKGIHPDDASPEHLFNIASKAKIGVFASQLGLISRYGMDHKDVPYLIKMNSKTNLVGTKQQDPYSEVLVSVDDVMEFKRESGLKILGVGYTIYLGSEFESAMLATASQIIHDAHNEGLVVVLWIYPRGKAVKDEKDPHLIAGATGVAACLGSDFVKVSYPEQKGKKSKDIFKEAVVSAGRTKVVCAGGGSTSVKAFLQTLKDQLDVGAGGNATGRNVHQKSLKDAVRMCNAIYTLTIEGKSVAEAMKVYNRK
jgi:fructose-bisphosphate aldolase / 6-deoxy-5-ketofructose 1-phosphate synthase